jgi:hypothetical protein
VSKATSTKASKAAATKATQAAARQAAREAKEAKEAKKAAEKEAAKVKKAEEAAKAKAVEEAKKEAAKENKEEAKAEREEVKKAAAEKAAARKEAVKARAAKAAATRARNAGAKRERSGGRESEVDEETSSSSSSDSEDLDHVSEARQYSAIKAGESIGRRKRTTTNRYAPPPSPSSKRAAPSADRAELSSGDAQSRKRRRVTAPTEPAKKGKAVKPAAAKLRHLVDETPVQATTIVGGALPAPKAPSKAHGARGGSMSAVPARRSRAADPHRERRVTEPLTKVGLPKDVVLAALTDCTEGRVMDAKPRKDGWVLLVHFCLYLSSQAPTLDFIPDHNKVQRERLADFLRHHSRDFQVDNLRGSTHVRLLPDSTAASHPSPGQSLHSLMDEQNAQESRRRTLAKGQQRMADWQEDRSEVKSIAGAEESVSQVVSDDDSEVEEEGSVRGVAAAFGGDVTVIQSSLCKIPNDQRAVSA